MKKTLFPLALLLITSKCFSQEIIPISKQEFKNSDFQKISTLKNELRDIKIIGLGESSHNMGETYSAKVKFIKYLHEKLQL